MDHFFSGCTVVLYLPLTINHDQGSYLHELSLSIHSCLSLRFICHFVTLINPVLKGFRNFCLFIYNNNK